MSTSPSMAGLRYILSLTLHCHDSEVECPLDRDYDDSVTYSDGPRLRPDLNPGGARWCDRPGHMRMECAKNRTKGRGPCHGPAVRGTDACVNHGGHTREVMRAKGQARISAWSAIGSGAQTMDYRMAVLGVLQMSWLRLAAYSDLLRRQVEAAPPQADPDGLAAGGEVNADGLIGYRYGAAGKDGNIYAVTEETRALVALEAAERDRVVKYAKTAHDMGISDRLTSLAEKWGDVVATRITLIMEGLNLTEEQARLAPALIQAHLGSIDTGVIDGDVVE